ncbi:MAG TPA: O-antigen translocase [Prolixibacteraceae bacterium]|jgi:O-antigen/teichoic acid export membrane protein
MITLTKIVPDQQSSYRQILRATSLFGAVQVFNIIISIIRSKFVAVLLGPTGMGIMGLLTSTIGMISRLTNFGLGTSAVKDIASALGTGKEKRIGIIITVIRRFVWITGLMGLIITAVLSHWLSQITFGSSEYSLAFIWLSISLLFDQLSSGQLVILQGLRQLNYLAKANLSGSFIGLFISIPLYYIWDLDGIVPGIIGSALFSLLMSWYFAKKTKFIKTPLSVAQTLVEGKNMLQVGFMISLSGFFSVAASYIVRIYISRIGGVDQVGLYTAGFAIINTYVGLIFNAMGTDYYPRLSAVAHDNSICKQTINQQAEIAILILAPILIVFLIVIQWVVILLYSRQFIAVNEMINWAALGMFFKAASWAVAFMFLAKGSGKLFFWNELMANAYLLAFNILGYHFWGLTGLGISFAIGYLVYLIQVYVISKIKFAFNFDSDFVKIFSIQLCLVLVVFLTINFLNIPYAYQAGTLLAIISGWYSIAELEKKMGLLSILRRYRDKIDSNFNI